VRVRSRCLAAAIVIPMALISATTDARAADISPAERYAQLIANNPTGASTVSVAIAPTVDTEASAGDLEVGSASTSPPPPDSGTPSCTRPRPAGSLLAHYYEHDIEYVDYHFSGSYGCEGMDFTSVYAYIVYNGSIIDRGGVDSCSGSGTCVGGSSTGAGEVDGGAGQWYVVADTVARMPSGYFWPSASSSPNYTCALSTVYRYHDTKTCRTQSGTGTVPPTN
jgi:hypothetical protein